MTESEIKVGDLVQLASGGPIMTVERIRPSDDRWWSRSKALIWCLWFDPKQHKKTASFYPEMLKRPRGKPVTATNPYTGKEFPVCEGDDDLSMADGRLAYECPVCRMGCSGKIVDGVVPIHSACYQRLKKEQQE